MITAIESRIRAIRNGMKNFTPKWLHFVPRFPQVTHTLKMCHTSAAVLALWFWFSENPYGFMGRLYDFRTVL